MHIVSEENISKVYNIETMHIFYSTKNMKLKRDIKPKKNQ